MAVDHFLKIDGIKGESLDAKHLGEIELRSFSWGLAHPHSMQGGGMGVGKVQVQELRLTAPVNSASPALAASCATGKHFPTALLTARKAGGKQQEYYTVKLSQVWVGDYRSTLSSGPEIPLPVDEFTLVFAKIEFEYKPQKADGTLDAARQFAYDLKQQA